MKSKKKTYLLITLIILILSPVIFFPLSSDHIIFLMGGKTIIEGGQLYNDFIDIKPPLLYMIFALLYKIAGFNEIIYRLFDFSWQLLTSFSIYFVTKKLIVNINIAKPENIGFLSALIYSILYSTLNFSQTMQCETLAALPLIWSIYLYFKAKRSSIILFVGLLLGMITGLKYTLGILLVGFLVFEILKPDNTILFKRLSLMLFGFILGLIFSSILLFDPSIYASYLSVLSYLKVYAKLQMDAGNSIQFLIKETSIFFGDKFSLLLLFSLLYGIVIYLKNISKKTGNNQYIEFLFVLMILLLFTVFLELKLTPYQFSRAYLPLSVISGFGLINLFYITKKFYFESNVINKLILLSILIFLSVMNPVPRWLNVMKPVYFYINDIKKYDNYYTRPGNIELIRNIQKETGRLIKFNSMPDDKLAIMAIGSNQVYLHSGLHKFSKFGQSQFYFSKGVPKTWSDAIFMDLKESNWLVIQTNDRHPSITGIDKSSFEILQDCIPLKELIDMNFKLIKTIDCYMIYQKK